MGAFSPNERGVQRSLAEAIAIACQADVDVDESDADVQWTLDPSVNWPTLAVYLRTQDLPGETVVHWKSLVNKYGAVLVRVSEFVTESDEAAVWMASHEVNEINALREEFAKSGDRLTVEILHGLVQAPVGSLHQHAVVHADGVLERWKERTP